MVWQAPKDDEDESKEEKKARKKNIDSEGDDKQSNDPWRAESNNGDGPPDLDEAFKKLHSAVVEFFGGGKGNKGNGGSAVANSGGFGIAFGLLILLAFILWVLSGIVIVSPSEKAVVLRLGAYHDTLSPGPHWIPRIIDNEQKINVTKVHSYDYSDQMLNKDENIIFVSMSVFYKIKNPSEYLFSVVDPEVSLKQGTASALRQVVGHTSLDDVMTIGREKVGEDVNKLLKKILARYNTGIEVTEVTIQEVKAPAQVQAAFDDAIKAREDEQRYIDKAKAYVASVLPIAEGNAQRLIEEANADKEQTILRAKGDVSRFAALLPEFKRAPRVTEERLYIDAWEEMLSNTSKVLVDTSKSGSNQLLYLPLDKLLREKNPVPLKQVDPQADGTQSNGSNHFAAADKGYTREQRDRSSYQRPTRRY